MARIKSLLTAAEILLVEQMAELTSAELAVQEGGAIAWRQKNWAS